MVGSTFKRVNVEQIRHVILAMPPEEEQFAISEAVDNNCSQIDSLITQAAQSAELLQERRSALISAAVTGKIDVRGWQAEEQAEPEDTLMAAEPRATYQ